MTPLLIVLALVVAVVLVWWGLRSRTGRSAEPHPTDNLDTLTAWPPTATRVLTTPEREAYDLLRLALPAHVVLAQVPLQRFIKVPTRNSYAEWLRRVGQLCADLVVCDRHSQVVAVVEVQTNDDTVSERALRRRARLAKVLKAAQVPVHVWSASALPSVEEAREAIAATLPATDMAPPAPFTGTRSLPGHMTNSATQPLRGAAAASPNEETAPLREPPPSTWFDELETGPVPLSPPQPPVQSAKDGKDRPAR